MLPSRNYPRDNGMLRHDRIDELFFVDFFLFCKKNKAVIKGKFLLSILCNRQRICACCANEEQALGVTGNKTIHGRDRGTRSLCFRFFGRIDFLWSKKYFIGIWTSFKVLEEGTPLENLAKLCIDAIKEEVSKDIKMKINDLCSENTVCRDEL